MRWEHDLRNDQHDFGGDLYHCPDPGQPANEAVSVVLFSFFFPLWVVIERRRIERWRLL